MRDYYGHARNIYRISKNIARYFRYQENQKYERARFFNIFKKDPKKNRQQIDGFVLGENQIYYDKRTIFEDDAYRLVRVFRIIQQNGLSLDFELQKAHPRKHQFVNEQDYLGPREITKSSWLS